MRVESYRGSAKRSTITTLIVPEGTNPDGLPQAVRDHLGMPLTKNKTYNLESTQPIIGVNAAEAHAALLRDGYYVAESQVKITIGDAPLPG